VAALDPGNQVDCLFNFPIQAAWRAVEQGLNVLPSQLDADIDDNQSHDLVCSISPSYVIDCAGGSGIKSKPKLHSSLWN
jgi:hypothetical protein